MKHIYTLVLLSINSITYSQVGINTDTPSAALEVISKTTLQNDIIFQSTNSNNNKLFSVQNNGDIDFTKALMPNGDPGKNSLYLVSQGEDSPPIWQDLPKGATVQILSAQNDVTSTTKVSIGTFSDIEFPILNSSLDATFGVWNSTNNRFTVSKKGVYLVTVGIDAIDMKDLNNNANSAANFALFIFANSNSYTGQGIVYKDNSNYNFSSVVSNYFILEKGNHIQIAASSGNSSWYQGPSFLSISYTELP